MINYDVGIRITYRTFDQKASEIVVHLPGAKTDVGYGFM